MRPESRHRPSLLVCTRVGGDNLEPNVLQVLIALEVLTTPTVENSLTSVVLAQSEVSITLARLQERGLPTTIPDPNDARRQRQGIIPEGCMVVCRLLGAAHEREIG